MADSITLKELKTRILKHADMENSSFIEDFDGVSLTTGLFSELTMMIQCSIQDFYDLLVDAWGNDYFFEEYSFATVANQKDYALPSNFYKFVGIDYVDTGGRIYPLKKFLFREREKYTNYSSANNQGYNLRYRLLGNNIRFMPTPTSVFNIKLYFIPNPIVPEDDVDTYDFIQGWEDYVIWDVVTKCLMKEESDPSAAMAERKNAQDKIDKMKENRDANEPDRILNMHDNPYRNMNINNSIPPDEY
jgi:hypothetical protein